MTFQVPSIYPRIYLGLRTDIKGNAYFLNNQEVIYPIGGVIVVHDHLQKKQRYIRLSEKNQLISMYMSPNKKVLAVYEKGEKGGLSLFDLTTLKKKRSLSFPAESTAKDILNMSFTYDSKNLLVLCGEPDYMVYNFVVDKGKIESSIKCAANVGTVSHISTGPNDNTVMVVSGSSVFKLMAYAEGAWRPWGFSKCEQFIITCNAYITPDIVVFGTVTGGLFIVENGELKQTWLALELKILDLKSKEEHQQSFTTLVGTGIPPEEVKPPSEEEGGGDVGDSVSIFSEVNPEPNRIHTMIGFARGWAFTIGNTCHVFEKDTNYKFRKRNIITVECSMGLGFIQHMAINIPMDLIMVTTYRSQLYVGKLWGPDVPQIHEGVFKLLGEELHHGEIWALDICSWKPIFITSGSDRTVRVWNYETGDLEMIKTYHLDVFGIALHPTSLFAAIGCADKLRYCSVLIDDLRPLRELPIRNCKELIFSHSGHMFAAANGNIIQVYSTITFECLMALKGHNGKIKSLIYNQMDGFLMSGGTEGAVYFWSMALGQRSGEFITKGISCNGVGVTGDGKTAFYVSGDGCMREVSDSMLMRIVTPRHPQYAGLPPNQMPPAHTMDCFAMARSDQMAFAGGTGGAVLSIKFPLMETGGGQCLEYRLHNVKVTRMKITFDDQYLITVSVDGSLAIWKIGNCEGRQVKLDKDFKYCKEILMPKVEMEERMQFIKGLEKRMKEIENEHAYQLRQGDAAHNEKMREVHAGYCEAIEELKEKNEQLEMDHTQEMNNINMEIAKTKAAHEKTMHEMESNFNEKLIVEYDKYARFEDRTADMRNDYEQRLKDMHALMEQSMLNLRNDLTLQLNQKSVVIEELQAEGRQRDREYEESKLQIEDDADRELLEMRTKYEAMLKEERDNSVRLRGEVGIMRKKFAGAQKEIEIFKMQIYTLQTEHTKFQQIIIGLERDIADLKKEISERDGTITDKERNITELKRKNQELEKYKFVLNYKIKELKNQIEPKEREIREKKDQIAEMEVELEGLQKINTTLELNMTVLREKMSGIEIDLKTERTKSKAQKKILFNVRNDLYEASGLVTNPNKLKQTIKELYHKYDNDTETIKIRAQDFDVHKEFARQRLHLESMIAGLKKRLNAEGGKTGQDVVKIMEENVTLISEINYLRKELKVSQRHVNEMEALLGCSSKKMAPRLAQEKLRFATTEREEIEERCEEKLKDLRDIIDILKEENSRLSHKLSEGLGTDDDVEITSDL